MATKLIIFDFDGTLGDTRRNIVRTMQMTIEELGLDARSEQQMAATIGLPLAGCFEALYPDSTEEVAQIYATTYRRLFDENMKTLVPQPFPTVVETLTALKEQGYTLAIASSRSHASLARLVIDMGFADSITYLIGADDVAHAKPDPEPVLNILDTLGFTAAETLVVGDMAVDILMGSRAGAKTCGVTWGNGTRHELSEAGADHIIERMEELIVLFQRS